LSSIRENLQSLVGGKELLLEIVLIDIKKGRVSTPNLELIPGVNRITPKVIQYLSHSNPKIRSSAASALGSIKNAKNIPILIKALDDKDDTVRSSVVVALDQIKDDRASSALEQTLKKINRPTLSRFLKAEKSPFVDHLSDFFNANTHSTVLDSNLSEKSRVSLSKILKPQEIIQITEILRSDLTRKDVYYSDSVIIPNVSCYSASILLDLGSELGVENCLEKIRKQSEQLSQKIDIFLKSQMLSNQGLGGQEILLGHDLSWTEISFLQLRARNYPYDRYMLSPLFVKLAAHQDIQIRRAAFLNLALNGGLQDQDLSLLLNGLRDPDLIIRRFSAYYFSRGFFKNDKVLQALLKASQDSDVKIRQFTVSALNRIEAPEAKNRIVKALDDPETTVRSTAALLLYEWNNQKNVPKLLDLLQKDPNAQVRSQVARALENSPKEILLDATLIALQDRDRNVNYSGISMLNKLIDNQTSLDPRFGAEFINLLRRLNVSKDIPVEDWASFIFGNSSFKVEALSTLSKLADRNALSEVDRSKAIPVLMSMYKNWSDRYNPPQRATIVKIIRKLNESEKVDRTAQQRTQQLFYLETGILGAIGVTAIGLLLSSIRLRNPFSLFFSTYLLFPEEVVAELIALKQRRQSERVRKWKIRLELAYEIITLIWAFHIQIRIDDLKLPPGGNRSAK
jgi:HEAT repeat protein